MVQSLYTLLYKIIDYAGMFPPASLELTEAFSNFINYTTDEHSWLLNRFIIPISKLGHLAEIYVRDKAENIPLSYLVTKIDSRREFILTLKNELRILQDFEKQFPESYDISYFELYCPQEVVIEGKQFLKEFVRDTTHIIANTRNTGYKVFYELPVIEFDETTFKYFIEYLATENLNGYSTAFKLRAGGTIKEQFPSSETISKIFLILKEFNVGFKATAGLHHPFRYFDSNLETKVHGFLNLFSAAVLNYLYTLEFEDLFSLLEDAEKKDFVFSDNYIAYKNWEIDSDSISKARREFAFSYGSCSFKEPVDDLKTFQLL